MPGIAPKLPLQFDKIDGYRLTKTIQENVRQNFKMLLFTVPGERVMDINFGVGLRNYVFRGELESVDGEIKARILKQVQRYMSFLNVYEISFIRSSATSLEFDDGVQVIIKYEFLPTGQLDTLLINLA